MTRIGVWMVDNVITPFIPPNTVKMVVRIIKPMAPAQKFKPQDIQKDTTCKGCNTHLSKDVSYEGDDREP